jgi:ProP effector
MANQTRADEGRGLGEKIVDSGSLADPQNTEISPAPQAPPKRRPYREVAIETLSVLRERFPAAFADLNDRRRQPLKVGIHADIVAALPELDAAAIRCAMRFYVCGFRYQYSVVEGAARIDLNGNAVGIVSADEAEHARLTVQGVKAKRRASDSTRSAPLVTPEKPQPKRLGLADLRAAVAQRKLSAQGA